MKKLISILLLIAMLCTLFASCGKKVGEEPDDTGAADTGAVEEEEIDYSDFDYSEGLSSDGTFEGVRALDYVTLPSIPVQIPTGISTVTDEEIQDEIDVLMESYATPTQILDRAVANGDTINIDYVGKIDGVAFENGSTNGQGTTVTIGVTTYIDDFLEQLVGHMPGETFDIEVTFPESYPSNTELQNKDAVFTVTINYIAGEDVLPELTDAFVAENFAESNGWSTAAELKSYIRDALFSENIKAYIQTYIIDLSEYTEVPDVVYDYQVGTMLARYASYASSYNIEIEDIIQKSVDEFVKDQEDTLINEAKFCLAMQAVYESYPELAVTEDDIKAFHLTNFGSEDFSANAEKYGEPYLYFAVMTETVMSYLIDNVTYEDPNVVIPGEDA